MESPNVVARTTSKGAIPIVEEEGGGPPTDGARYTTGPRTRMAGSSSGSSCKTAGDGRGGIMSEDGATEARVGAAEGLNKRKSSYDG